MEPGPETPSEPRHDEGEEFDTGPGPPRGAFLLAYLGVVLAGLVGGALGFAIVEATCHGDCTVPELFGSVIAAALTAIGAGVVAVLGLRAMAEWRRPRTR